MVIDDSMLHAGGDRLCHDWYHGRNLLFLGYVRLIPAIPSSVRYRRVTSVGR